MNKQIILGITALLICVGLSGCNEKIDSEIDTEDFEGTWYGYFFSEKDDGCYTDSVTFSENNMTCHLSGDDCNYDTDTLLYRYTITNDTLMMYVHGYEYASVNFTVRFEDNKNILFLTYNDDNEYRLVKYQQ